MKCVSQELPWPYPCLGCTAEWLRPALSLLASLSNWASQSESCLRSWLAVWTSNPCRGMPLLVLTGLQSDLLPCLSWDCWWIPPLLLPQPCSDPKGQCSLRGYKLNQPPKATGLTTQCKESPSSMGGSGEKVFPAPRFFETAQASSPRGHSLAEA